MASGSSTPIPNVPSRMSTITEYEDYMDKYPFSPVIFQPIWDTELQKMLIYNARLASESFGWKYADTIIDNVTFGNDMIVQTRYDPSTDTVVRTNSHFPAGTQYKQTKYTYKYSASANTTTNISITNFGLTYDARYTPVGVVSYSSGTKYAVPLSYRINWSQSDITTGTGTVMSVRSVANVSNVSAYITILYIRTSYA